MQKTDRSGRYFDLRICSGFTRSLDALYTIMAQSAVAQSTFGSILGVVKDPNGLLWQVLTLHCWV
jgi:hypothetical protein